MKNSLLAIALGVATMPLTFAQTAPAPAQNPPAQNPPAKTAAKKSPKKHTRKPVKNSTATPAPAPVAK